MDESWKADNGHGIAKKTLNARIFVSWKIIPQTVQFPFPGFVLWALK